MLLALVSDSYGESHSCFIVSTHLASYLVSACGCGWECEIGGPCCARHDWFKLYEHSLELYIRWEWASIWLIWHDHELVNNVSAIWYNEVVMSTGMKDCHWGNDAKLNKRELDFYWARGGSLLSDFSGGRSLRSWRWRTGCNSCACASNNEQGQSQNEQLAQELKIVRCANFFYTCIFGSQHWSAPS